MSKSKIYKKDRDMIYHYWDMQGLTKAPIRLNFPKIIINTLWQFIAWCIGLAVVVSLITFGLKGIFTGEAWELILSLIKITWIPYTLYTLYWTYRVIDIIIYDKKNYPKYLKER